MHWTAPPEMRLEHSGNAEVDEQVAATFDPLLYQANAVIALISRCEMLLEKRRADLNRQAGLLDEAKSAMGNHREAAEIFKQTLQKLLGAPLGDAAHSHRP
jgi:hypothetical protein